MQVNFCHKCHRCNKAFSEIFKVARVSPGTSTDAAREILGFAGKHGVFWKSYVSQMPQMSQDIPRDFQEFNLQFMFLVWNPWHNVQHLSTPGRLSRQSSLFNWARVGKRIAHSVDFFHLIFDLGKRAAPNSLCNALFDLEMSSRITRAASLEKK